MTLQTGPLDPESVLAVLNRALPDHFDLARYARQILLDPNTRPEGEFLALQNGAPVGYALGVTRQVPLEGTWPDGDTGYLWLLGVVPEARGHGVGTALLNAVESALHQAGARKIVVSGYVPGYVTPGVDLNHDPSAESFLLKRGYTAGPLALSMRHPLTDLSGEETFLDLRDDLLTHVPQVLDFAREHFGPEWVRFYRESLVRQSRGDRQTGTSAAFEKGEIAGFAHFDGARFGPIGTHPGRRGGGIGHALMTRILRRQSDLGLDHSFFLWSNPDLAARFYAPAGWKEARRFRVMSKRRD